MYRDYTRDDAVADAEDAFNEYEADKCEECDEELTDDYFDIYGDKFCTDCAQKLFRKRVY